MPSFSFATTFLKSQFKALPYPSGSFSGFTVIVTGANIGLGLEAARHVVRLDAAKVILAVRDIGKGEAAKRDIEASTKRSDVVEVWQLDLGSYKSVIEFAKKAGGLDRLDAVIENAGVATDAWEMVERDEKTITVNVTSTFLLALLLLPKLRQSAAKFSIVPRLVIVSSEAHELAKFPERESPDIFTALNDKSKAIIRDRYNVSKLIEILVVRELAEKLTASGKPQITLNTLTPGFCHSRLSRNAAWDMQIAIRITKFLLARTTEVGSRTLVHAAGDKEPETHGKYLANCEVGRPSPFVVSPEGAEVQKKVYAELMSKLEAIQPGITSNI